MDYKKQHKVTMIRRSCITGKVIWIYRGKSRNAGYQAYHKAVKHELERVKHWPEYVAERRARILKFLNDCLAALPINAELTPKQKAAVRTLKKIADEPQELDLDFYNHIMAEKERRPEVNKFGISYGPFKDV